MTRKLAHVKLKHQHTKHKPQPKIQVPPHLKAHIAKQDYKLYTAIDHASWRFIMRISKAFFKNHAHEKYIKGLIETGITIDRIPRITEMDKKLKKFGWSAVTITGFIPPSVFLEFQSLSILPIACDMRRLEHLEYTPSPDIVHEAAGHAPIISDPKYSAYLHKFGEIARKAIFAKEDLEVYEAIKHLSDIKEAPHTTQAQIDEAYERLEKAHKQVTYASEATKLSRLGWWSIEYGLVKRNNDYKIYGAGLLSSVGESFDAIVHDVKRLPLTIDCTNVDYDITKPQPQLFYVEDFKQLEAVIDDLAASMAYKMGGIKALKLAEQAGTVTTTVLASGLQISGVLKNIITEPILDSDKTSRSNKTLAPTQEPIYLQYSGPVQLAYNDTELTGHSAKYHAQGYGTPVGHIAKQTQLVKNQHAKIEYKSGVTVEGIYLKTLRKNNTDLVHTFKNCTVRLKDQILFDPSWGFFDLACGGENIPSVFGGAADRTAYAKATTKGKHKMKVQTSNITAANKPLVPLYEKVRKIREQMSATSIKTAASTKNKKHLYLKQLNEISEVLDQKFADDWLLRIEILELLTVRYKNNKDAIMLKEKLNHQLDHLSNRSDVYATLIRRGRELFS